jgi:hypothetical protein
MQPYIQTFLALLFAHLLGDFPLQTGGMVRAKVGFVPVAYFRHGLIHLLLAAAALILFTPLTIWRPMTILALALLVAGHLALDLGKSAVIRKAPRLDGAGLYISDQIVHVAIVAVAATVALQTLPSFDVVLPIWSDVRDELLILLVIVAATVFPSGYLIRYLLAPLSRQLAGARDLEDGTRDSFDGLSNAGLYLGWLERALLVIAFGFGSMAAVGLIIGAKSVARFPEFKSRAFAEYFLIGTLISVTIAAIGGLVLRMATGYRF